MLCVTAAEGGTSFRERHQLLVLVVLDLVTQTEKQRR